MEYIRIYLVGLVTGAALIGAVWEAWRLYGWRFPQRMKYRPRHARRRRLAYKRQDEAAPLPMDFGGNTEWL